MRTPEENTELDYQLAEHFNITIDEIDALPISILSHLRDTHEEFLMEVAFESHS
jgi:hypothetical protein